MFVTPSILSEDNPRDLDAVTSRRSLDRTAVIFGYGSIGRALAARLAPVRSTSSQWRARPEPETSTSTQGTPPPRCRTCCPADEVAITAPLTPVTRGAFGAQMLDLLPGDTLAEPRMARFVRSQLTAFAQTGVLPHVVATG